MNTRCVNRVKKKIIKYFMLQSVGLQLLTNGSVFPVRTLKVYEELEV